jgi:hypothetical protein
VTLPSKKVNDPNSVAPKLVAIRWWVQRWGWWTDEDGLDYCPDHEARANQASKLADNAAPASSAIPGIT